MKKSLSMILYICVFLFFLANSCFAATVGISATSSASVVTTGPYAGWYEYEYEVEWDFSSFGSQIIFWDLILDVIAQDSSFIFIFDAIAGMSTSDNSGGAETFEWEATLLLSGDPEVGTTMPLIKFTQIAGQSDSPGEAGTGHFRFISNASPKPETDWPTDARARYDDQLPDGYYEGPVTGDKPSCLIVPEPGMVLSFLGLLLSKILRRRE